MSEFKWEEETTRAESNVVVEVYTRKPSVECPGCGKEELTYMLSKNIDFSSAKTLKVIKSVLKNRKVAPAMRNELYLVEYCPECEKNEIVENKEKQPNETWEEVLGTNIQNFLENNY